jgi:hypothetical protein
MSAEEITAEYVTKRSSGAPSPQPSHHSNHQLEGAATDFDMLRPQENHRCFLTPQNLALWPKKRSRFVVLNLQQQFKKR